MKMVAVRCCRDRTSEFRSLSSTLKNSSPSPFIKAQHPLTDGNDGVIVASSRSSSSPSSEFNRKASSIGASIHDASRKISRLSKLARRSSMFNDPVVEIEELTALIRNEITALNEALSELQVLRNADVESEHYSNDRVVHTSTICDDLKNKLMGTAKQFKDVLTTRTENLKAHENRRQIFSTSTSRQNPFVNHAKTVSDPPPWSNATAGLPYSGMPSNTAQNVSQLRRRLAADTPSQQMEMSMLQRVVPRQEHYTHSRAAALQNVESTISELGGIFTQLATMVAHQGELAIRIDDNMDETLGNVEGARSALLKYLSRTSSNRGKRHIAYAVIALSSLISRAERMWLWAANLSESCMSWHVNSTRAH